MKRSECTLKCEVCGRDAEYCDSVPDANGDEYHYRLKSLCWVHAVERRAVATSRVNNIVRCEMQEIGRLDRGRASGLCECIDCGRQYYDHPREIEHTFLNLLCDGSVVKL